ncbi:MAG: right-handed parallel beta-helix repeat-containing protein [Eubacterium sp.]|nr:right-handed parallel beta-helix repeat-containing protein [Eubacterium sp.]
MKKRRNAIDKLNTLLFGKDLRIIEGEPYTEVREFDFSSYYPVDNYVTNQSLPDSNVYDIRDFGADTSSEDNAEYINLAIEQASKTQGTVLISGGDYVTTTVTLKSGITLFIERDSSLSSNKTGKGYEAEGSIIFAENEHNITITGGGKINGNGNFFGRKPQADSNFTENAEYIDVIKMRRDYRSQLRFAHPSKYGSPIVIKECRNVTIDNFIIENSASWSLKLIDCKDVSISDFVINNNRNVANADGIDIAGSSNVDIRHCFISTADDGIVIKNAIWLGNKGAMSNINISDCEVISRTNSIKIGTETTYDIFNVNIDNCRLFMTDLYPGTVSGIAIESCDGSKVYNVSVSNIEMNRCTCPIFVRLGNRNRASIVNAQTSNAIEFGKKVKFVPSAEKSTFDEKSELRDITITDVRATGVELPIIIAGYKQKGRVHRVENLMLKNIDIEYSDLPEIIDRRLFIPEYAKEYPESWRFRNLPAYALWSRHTKNLSIDNFNCTHSLSTWKEKIIQIDNI